MIFQYRILFSFGNFSFGNMTLAALYPGSGASCSSGIVSLSHKSIYYIIKSTYYIHMFMCSCDVILLLPYTQLNFLSALFPWSMFFFKLEPCLVCSFPLLEVSFLELGLFILVYWLSFPTFRFFHYRGYDVHDIETYVTFICRTYWNLSPLHSTPLTGRAIKPQRQGHIGGPIAQPWGGEVDRYVSMYACSVGRERGEERALYCRVYTHKI